MHSGPPHLPLQRQGQVQPGPKPCPRGQLQADHNYRLKNLAMILPAHYLGPLLRALPLGLPRCPEPWLVGAYEIMFFDGEQA